ncbi:uncharacterized protein LOC112452989 isoform X1 [Temnothorax curvispinosus]|uniref:Uncharacterized protein LOC112452989 isoform X1 n=1 Tax=Temnothorax curvispinosus TaxID=300111 RepID=A0A6J1PIW6_9HYME|nr:uncharacterized protein LOC112452989 isoform X1 [Temnothorax curvispinosus]
MCELEFPLLFCCVFGLFFELSLYTDIYDRLPYKDLYTALSMLTHRLNVSLESPLSRSQERIVPDPKLRLDERLERPPFVLQDCSSAQNRRTFEKHRRKKSRTKLMTLHCRRRCCTITPCVPIMWLVISDVPVTSPTWNADLFLLSASLLNPQVYSHMGEFDVIAIGFSTSSHTMHRKCNRCACNIDA